LTSGQTDGTARGADLVACQRHTLSAQRRSTAIRQGDLLILRRIKRKDRAEHQHQVRNTSGLLSTTNATNEPRDCVRPH
jgi:hypothetical protein